jgi:hypothetical protein
MAKQIQKILTGLLLVIIATLTAKAAVTAAMVKVASVTVLWQVLVQVLMPAFIFYHTISNPLSNF